MKYWLYYFIRYQAELPFRAYFRSIHIEGKSKIPKGKPVLIAASHAGSFLDGVVIEYTSRYKAFTLVRGDAFNKPTFNKILRSMLLLPIYRAQDAHAEKARKGNASTFDECYELFKLNAKILIFSEGIAAPEKTTRKLKKGTAAMAAEMVQRDRGELDLYIVPCGINYSHFAKMRCSVQINYGEAIRVKDYISEIKQDEKKFVKEFTEDLQTRFDALVVKTKGEYEVEKEIAHEILLNEFDDRSFFREYNTGSEAIVAGVDAVSAESAGLIVSYNKALSQHKISDRNLSENNTNFIAILVALCTAMWSLPFAILYRLMWFVSKRLADKNVKNVVMFDSFYFGIGIIATMIWYLIVAVMIFAVLPLQWTLIWQVIAFIAVLVGTSAWFTTASEIPHLWKQLKYWSMSKEERDKIRNMRSQILNFLKQ